MSNEQQPAVDEVVDVTNTTAENSRRTFLRAGVVTAGALALGGLGATPGRAQDANNSELVLKLKEHDALSQVGGFEVIDTAGGKVIVAHTEENTFVACSALCPHRGCPVKYSPDDKQFVCPCHNSRFGLDGSVIQGPARTGLKPFGTDEAAVVSLA